jgi:hypothetical protein
MDRSIKSYAEGMTMQDNVCGIGYGIYATGCGFEAITLVERAEVLPPPPDQKALPEAVKAYRV